jgi:hypothetical protein
VNRPCTLKQSALDFLQSWWKTSSAKTSRGRHFGWWLVMTVEIFWSYSTIGSSVRLVSGSICVGFTVRTRQQGAARWPNARYHLFLLFVAPEFPIFLQSCLCFKVHICINMGPEVCLKFDIHGRHARIRLHCKFKECNTYFK